MLRDLIEASSVLFVFQSMPKTIDVWIFNILTRSWAASVAADTANQLMRRVHRWEYLLDMFGFYCVMLGVRSIADRSSQRNAPEAGEWRPHFSGRHARSQCPGKLFVRPPASGAFICFPSPH